MILHKMVIAKCLQVFCKIPWLYCSLFIKFNYLLCKIYLLQPFTLEGTLRKITEYIIYQISHGVDIIATGPGYLVCRGGF